MENDLKLPVIKDIRIGKKALSMDEYAAFCQFNFDQLTDEQKKLFGIEKLNLKRSQLPAITHVDYSARIQTIHEDTNPGYYNVIKAFNDRTGCGVIVNTSFNVRGEPIVCTPDDAYRCFMRTEMDYLVVENFLLSKTDQPNYEDSGDWQSEFELD